MSNLLPAWKEQRLRAWWAGEPLATPCIAGTVTAPEAQLPQASDLTQFWTDVDFIIERRMAEIEQTTYYGCAVPVHYVDQGSSAMAGVLGCPLEFIDEETAWAHPAGDSLETAMGTSLSPAAPVWDRIRELTRRSAALARDHHFVGMFALEGMTDLLAALYGIENFLMDTLDRPGDLGAAVAHLNGLWLEACMEVEALIAGSGNPGTCGWAGVWAPGTTFPLQEDVAYNLAPTQFRDLCLPALVERITHFDCPFFHLDGKGMIPHLPYLLELPDLPVIQWVPGAGNWAVDQWYDLIRRILDAGKRVQLFVAANEVEPLVDAVGAAGLFLRVTDASDENMNDLLERFPQE